MKCAKSRGSWKVISGMYFRENNTLSEPWQTTELGWPKCYVIGYNKLQTERHVSWNIILDAVSFKTLRPIARLCYKMTYSNLPVACCIVVSARLWNFQLGYAKYGRSLHKNQHPKRKWSYLVNKTNGVPSNLGHIFTI